MCNRLDCENNMGKWVQFQTQWGNHRGIVSGVNHNAVLMRVPRQYAPAGLASDSKTLDLDDEQRLDLALAQWGGGYGGYGYPGGAGGYGATPYGGGYGGRWGRPGYGGWYGGWWWWWLAFAWIFWLAFLW